MAWREPTGDVKRGWKVFLALLVWFSVMTGIWFFWPD